MGPTVTMKVSCQYVSSTQHGLCKKNQKELLRAKLVLVKLMVWLIGTGTWLGVLVVVLAAQFVSRCLLKPTPGLTHFLRCGVWMTDRHRAICLGNHWPLFVSLALNSEFLASCLALTEYPEL